MKNSSYATLTNFGVVVHTYGEKYNGRLFEINKGSNLIN
jgi:hypothetical protein